MLVKRRQWLWLIGMAAVVSLVAVGGSMRPFFAAHDCLDVGGNWDDAANRCTFDPPSSAP